MGYGYLIRRFFFFILSLICSASSFSAGIMPGNERNDAVFQPSFSIPLQQPSSLQYSINGLEFGFERSSLFGGVAETKLIKKIGDANAIALELNYGQNKNRIGLTWGFEASSRDLFKVTAERLSE